MINLELEHERLSWQGMVSRSMPFMAEDLWFYFNFLGKLHNHDWNEPNFYNPNLILDRGDSYHYHLGYGDGDPDSSIEEERYDQYRLSLVKMKTDKEMRDSMAKGKCFISEYDEIETFSLEKKDEDDFVLWSDIRQGTIYSPSAATGVFYEADRLRIYDTQQNARSFGIGLARNLWVASEHTLAEQNRFPSVD